MLALIGPVWSFLGSKLGGWAAAGVVAAVLGGWIWIDGLRLDAKDGDIAQLQADVGKLEGQVKTLYALSEEKDRKIDGLTVDATTFRAKADQIATELAVKTAAHAAQTLTLMKRIADAQTAADRLPVPPGMAAGLVGLLELYPGPPDSAGSAPDRKSDAGPVGADSLRPLRAGGS